MSLSGKVNTGPCLSSFSSFETKFAVRWNEKKQNISKKCIIYCSCSNLFWDTFVNFEWQIGMISATARKWPKSFLDPDTNLTGYFYNRLWGPPSPLKIWQHSFTFTCISVNHSCKLSSCSVFLLNRRPARWSRLKGKNCLHLSVYRQLFLTVYRKLFSTVHHQLQQRSQRGKNISKFSFIKTM